MACRTETHQRWSGLTTVSRFRSAISRNMASSRTGRRSLTISGVTGRPTTTTPMLISCAKGACGNGAARAGNSRRRRLTEERAGGAKSVFHFDVQGSVAKSTHAGIPWLLFVRQRLGECVHFWPFDGWDIPSGRSAVTEVYPALGAADRTLISTMLIALPPGSPPPTGTAASTHSSSPP
jgi:hypothetical protein